MDGRPSERLSRVKILVLKAAFEAAGTLRTAFGADDHLGAKRIASGEPLLSLLELD